MTMPHVATAGMDAGQRRLAARYLLASSILTAARDPAELELVRRHAPALKSMFAPQLGYALVVESTFARLVKAPLPASAPVRSVVVDDGRIRAWEEEALVAVLGPANPVGRRPVRPLDREDLRLTVRLADVVALDDDLVSDLGSHLDAPF